MGEEALEMFVLGQQIGESDGYVIRWDGERLLKILNSEVRYLSDTMMMQ